MGLQRSAAPLSTTSVVAGRTRDGIAYTVRGAGPPLLWISGYVVPARAFDTVLVELALGYTVVTADHRGSGESGKPWLPTTTATMASDVVSVLDHLDVDSAHIVGLSLGSMVAQEVAIRWPQRVRSLVVGCTSAGGVGVQVPSAVDALAEVRRSAGLVATRRQVSVLGAFRQAWAASTHDAGRRLGTVSAPTLVLHGAADRLVPVANAKWVADRIPGARLRVVEDAGHLLVLDSPAARRELRGWLDVHRSVGAGAPRSPGQRVSELFVAPCRSAAAQSLPVRRLIRAGSRRVR